MSRHGVLAIQRIVVTAAIVALGVLVYSAARTISKGRYGDFTHFYEAAMAVRAGGDVHSSGERGYIYPPLLAFLFQPLTFMPLPRAVACWLALNVALLVGATVIASRDAIRRFGAPGWTRPAALIAAAAFLLTLDKTRASLNQAQTDCLVLLGFVLGLYWLERRPVLTGVAIGFAANIKYLSLIAIPYLLLRRRWAAAASAVASTVAWALLPALSLGWDQNLRSLRTAGAGLLGAVGVRIDGGAANVHADEWNLSISITSAVARLLGTDASPALKASATLIVVLVVLGAAWAIYRARGRAMLAPVADQPGGNQASQITALEWAGLVVGSLAFGPQTTGRHLVLMLGVHALIATLLIGPLPIRRKVPLAVGLVLFQLAMVLPPGGPRFQAAADAWRAVGGASWCLLVLYITMLWTVIPEREVVNPASPPGVKPGDPLAARSST